MTCPRCFLRNLGISVGIVLWVQCWLWWVGT